MSQRGISTVPAILLAAAAGMVTALLMMDWVVVDVTTADTGHVVVPCPLMVPRLAAAFIPDDAFADAEIPAEMREQRPAVLAAVKELLDAPDGALVRVTDPETRVEITKSGRLLEIAVDADDAVVRCKIPIDGVYEALEEWDWQQVDPELLFDVLDRAPGGSLVSVKAEDANVDIRVW
jgi:hypothetical protein